MKDDPLQQSTISDQVREQMSKHTLWLNADNFGEMVQASFESLRDPELDAVLKVANEAGKPADQLWRAMCAAALAVVEWRMGGRVRP